MVVDCRAPGNRHKIVYLKPTVSTSTFFNAGTGVVPGLAWDYASKAMYNYPKMVSVDFTYTEVKPFALPAQNLDDVRPPEDYDLEEFSPTLPRLNSDRYATAPEVRRREIPTDFDLQGFAVNKEQGEVSAHNFDTQESGGDSATTGTGLTSKIRVIGTPNEGLVVPTPPSAGQNNVQSTSSGNDATSAAETSAEESSAGSAAPASGGAPPLIPSKP